MNARYVLGVAGLFLMAAAHAQLPAPAELQKDGDCPSNYLAKGSSCVPAGSAKFAVSKFGNCPDGYEAEGAYCVATPTARLAMRRAAMSCPSGYESTGNYCLSEK